MKRLSNSALNLEGQKMFQILAQAKELENKGRKIYHFEIGDPDFPTPTNVVEKCIDSLKNGHTHYTKSSGMDELKEASKKRSLLSRGFEPENDQIIVTAGANVQIFYALACTVNPGEEVVTVDPCFVSYRSIMKFLNIKPKFVPLYEENQFRLSPHDLRKAITHKTRAILINSPHNPTGSVLTRKEMEEIFQIAREHDVYLISDEVYGRMVFSDNNVSSFYSPSTIDHCKERTIVVHSLSKSYSMTGWRIGAATGPKEVIEKMTLLLETTSSCVSPFIQIAATEALLSSQDEISEMMQEFKMRRDLMIKLLNRINGVSCLSPQGSFYAFANIKESGLSDIEFAEKILSECGVAACPGSFFGDQGKGYVRFCFATSQVNITQGIQKLIDLFE